MGFDRDRWSDHFFLKNLNFLAIKGKRPSNGPLRKILAIHPILGSNVSLVLEIIQVSRKNSMDNIVGLKSKKFSPESS